MSVNSSPSPNVSFTTPSNSDPVNIYYILIGCLSSTVGYFSLTFFTIVNILVILPLCILVLHLVLHRRRPSRTMSLSDLITFCTVTVELCSVLGLILTCCGIHSDVRQMVMAGLFFAVVHMSGEMLFHTLTCVERYLAVVHPIAYLNLKKGKGLRIRNIPIGCTWAFTLVGASFLYMNNNTFIFIICQSSVVFVFLVVLFCSLSVLCVLIHPGPGDRVGGKKQVGQKKLKAFYTIMAIMGVLLFRFVGVLSMTAVYVSPKLGEIQRCYVWVSAVWLSLPSSLLSPLLFLRSAGKLVCHKSSGDS